MKRFILLGLLGVFLLSACTPKKATPPPPPPVQLPEPSEPTSASAEAEMSEFAPVAPTEAISPTAEPILAIPTSRGNKLEATDPTTVNIASGEPQLIEFFAFW